MDETLALGCVRCKEEEDTVPALVVFTEEKREKTVKIITQCAENKLYK